ncbi:hypothetical protein H4R34_005268 [Dimargaris verticillata]|uniref:Uncharacterized protein n=1 Tax=Dimargaris verticillata TaxID=2761393 RepID=A0A9W8B0X9_9FUNG|nr:hypothetical protein H4R34_005268 [Dimargaris verticillata]
MADNNPATRLDSQHILENRRLLNWVRYQEQVETARPLVISLRYAGFYNANWEGNSKHLLGSLFPCTPENFLWKKELFEKSINMHEVSSEDDDDDDDMYYDEEDDTLASTSETNLFRGLYQEPDDEKMAARGSDGDSDYFVSEDELPLSQRADQFINDEDIPLARRLGSLVSGDIIPLAQRLQSRRTRRTTGRPRKSPTPADCPLLASEIDLDFDTDPVLLAPRSRKRKRPIDQPRPYTKVLIRSLPEHRVGWEQHTIALDDSLYLNSVRQLKQYYGFDPKDPTDNNTEIVWRPRVPLLNRYGLNSTLRALASEIWDFARPQHALFAAKPLKKYASGVDLSPRYGYNWVSDEFDPLPGEQGVGWVYKLYRSPPSVTVATGVPLNPNLEISRLLPNVPIRLGRNPMYRPLPRDLADLITRQVGYVAESVLDVYDTFMYRQKKRSRTFHFDHTWMDVILAANAAKLPRQVLRNTYCRMAMLIPCKTGQVEQVFKCLKPNDDFEFTVCPLTYF